VGKSSPTSGRGGLTHVTYRSHADRRSLPASTVTIDGADRSTVKGPKGTLSHAVASSRSRSSASEDGTLAVIRPDDERASRSLHGLTRTLDRQHDHRRHPGLRARRLEISGTGYRVAAKGQRPGVRPGLQPPGRGRGT
jgi:large subunit ribosomal protein L6